MGVMYCCSSSTTALPQEGALYQRANIHTISINASPPLDWACCLCCLRRAAAVIGAACCIVRRVVRVRAWVEPGPCFTCVSPAISNVGMYMCFISSCCGIFHSQGRRLTCIYSAAVEAVKLFARVQRITTGGRRETGMLAHRLKFLFLFKNGCVLH